MALVVMILLGVTFVGGGGFLVYRKHRLATVGQRVSGTVIGMREHVTRDPDGFEQRSWNTVLGFRTADGQDIRTEVSGGYGMVQVGAQVGVIYDPRNPRNAEIDSPAGRSRATGYIFMVVGLLVIVFGIVLVR